ncbi:MAG: DNA repair exonuclease [Candidatus Aenigmarchaeota archaeon]|nr:DNA repair exonuclease [Candidatus Aenigmarchaeota archaeon]
MKLAIFSDTHLGFGRLEGRYQDAFEAFEEAIEKSLECDAILIAGDIFDSQHPDAETFSRAIECMVKAHLSENRTGSIKGIGKDMEKLNPLCLMGIPILALHGNHERRARGLLNPVQAMEKAGFLIHLHANGAILEKDGERVAVQGLSAVPDAYLPEILRQWDPKPAEGCYNVLLMHQIIEGFAFGHRPLKLTNVPKGFDILIDGDIHEKHMERAGKNGSTLLISGSTIATKLDKKAEEMKGIWLLDTRESSLNYVSFEKQRRTYFLDAGQAERNSIEEFIGQILEKKHDKKPLIRIRHSSKNDFLQLIAEKYSKDAIISFRREMADSIQGEKMQLEMPSVTELGKGILRAGLSDRGLEPEIFETIFDLLCEGKEKDAMEMVEEFSRRNAKKQLERPAEKTGRGKGAKRTGDFISRKAF